MDQSEGESWGRSVEPGAWCLVPGNQIGWSIDRDKVLVDYRSSVYRVPWNLIGPQFSLSTLDQQVESWWKGTRGIDRGEGKNRRAMSNLGDVTLVKPPYQFPVLPQNDQSLNMIRQLQVTELQTIAKYQTR